MIGKSEGDSFGLVRVNYVRLRSGLELGMMDEQGASHLIRGGFRSLLFCHRARIKNAWVCGILTHDELLIFLHTSDRTSKLPALV